MWKTLLLLASVVPPALAGMYAEPVVHLDAKTFKKAMATEHASMVAFVAPWCGHCRNLGPEYTSAAQSLSPLIPFYAIDCDDDLNKPLCAEYGIQGFPTIKAFPRAGKGAARDYTGERKKGALIEYAKGLVPDRVKKLRAEGSLDQVIGGFLHEKPDIPHALLVHPSTPSIPFLWKVLGHRFSSKIHMGYIKDTPSHEVLFLLGLYDPKETTRDGARTIIFSPGASLSDGQEYDGVLKFNGLLEWLQSQLDGTASTKKTSRVKSEEDIPESDKAGEKQKEVKIDDAAEERKRRLAKLEEAEKRDKARREKANKVDVAESPSPESSPDPETSPEVEVETEKVDPTGHVGGEL
ncbi:protein disulfide-isomerase domain [Tremella mesenterica]|uniref:Protein disulfide-isomerase domain n=1 Tax=Tremella mesenterica TaxID=5217 RepID=A0A4Q1BWP8_TREME|nr:protein disulfide-isomerase domain [Tremella mesenterica]